MGIDFNAAFNKLNTNTEGNSANILDETEVNAATSNGSIWTLNVGMTAEQFKAANQHCAEQDTNSDGVVTVKEQKASIQDQLRNVWDSCIARFFKDDITYDDSSASVASRISAQVKARIQKMINKN